MQLECNREKLIHALQQTEKISRKNLSLPILSRVLMEVEDNRITLKATNLTVGVETGIGALVEEGGLMAIDGGFLLQVLNQMKGDTKVRLLSETDSGELLVEAEGVKASVPTYPTDDFPSLPHVEDGERVTLPIELFQDGIRSVVYSAAVNDIKPEIASVYMYKDEKDLVFVATDSFRLAEKRITDVVSDTDTSPLLLPAQAIQEVVRILDGESGEVELVVGDSLVECVTEHTTITVRVIDGSFPDYRLIIPKEFVAEGMLLKQEFLNRVRLVTLFSDKFGQLDMGIDPEGKKMTLSATNSDVGASSVEVVASLKGEAVTMRLNHRYLLDGFQSISADSVEILSAGERKPIVVRGVNDKTFTYLVMPMNR